LELEIEVMQEIVAYLTNVSSAEHIVIDTTGSVIYTGKAILRQLAAVSKVVYLHTPSLVLQRMYEAYIKDPKPVIWGDAFSPKEGETNMQTLERCYAQLLRYRTKKYKENAEIIFDYHLLRHDVFDTNLLATILEQYD